MPGPSTCWIGGYFCSPTVRSWRPGIWYAPTRVIGAEADDDERQQVQNRQFFRGSRCRFLSDPILFSVVRSAPARDHQDFERYLDTIDRIKCGSRDFPRSISKIR